MLATIDRSMVKQDTKSGVLRKTHTVQMIITYNLETMYCSHCDGGNRRRKKTLPHSHHCDAKTRAARYAPAKSQASWGPCPRTSQALLFSPFSSPPPQADPQGLANPGYTEVDPDERLRLWHQWGNRPLYPITAAKWFPFKQGALGSFAFALPIYREMIALCG